MDRSDYETFRNIPKNCLTKHHLLWGGIIGVLVVVALVTYDQISYLKVGFFEGPGGGVGFGQGALVIGGLLTQSGIEGIEHGETSYVDGKIYTWFEIEEGAVLLIPVWVLILIPLGFWIVAITRFSRKK